MSGRAPSVSRFRAFPGGVSALFLLATLGCPEAGGRIQDSWGPSDARGGAGVSAHRDNDAGVTQSTPVARPVLVSLSRADVDRVLARGPQPFVRDLDLEAVLVDTRTTGRRFVGWRIVRYFSDRAYRAVDIAEGDIVTSVNSLPVERPADWMRIWDELRRAPEIRIETIRDGEPRTIRVPILRD